MKSIIFKKISFNTVKEEIEKIFSSNSLIKWALDPDGIHKLAEERGVPLKWIPIEWWDSFENGTKDIDFNTYSNTLFKRFKPTKERLLIVTDECFKEGMAYELKYCDLNTFVEMYPELHHMDFIEPNDTLFIFPEDQLITALSHSGYVMQFKKS